MSDEVYNPQKDGEEFAKTFSRFCNSMSRTPKDAAIAELMKEHRTIQQNMMRFFMLFCEKMAEQRFDLRNEASVKLAKQIVELEHHLPFI